MINGRSSSKYVSNRRLEPSKVVTSASGAANPTLAMGIETKKEQQCLTKFLRELLANPIENVVRQKCRMPSMVQILFKNTLNGIEKKLNNHTYKRQGIISKIQNAAVIMSNYLKEKEGH